MTENAPESESAIEKEARLRRVMNAEYHWGHWMYFYLDHILSFIWAAVAMGFGFNSFVNNIGGENNQIAGWVGFGGTYMVAIHLGTFVTGISGTSDAFKMRHSQYKAGFDIWTLEFGCRVIGLITAVLAAINIIPNWSSQQGADFNTHTFAQIWMIWLFVWEFGSSTSGIIIFFGGLCCRSSGSTGCGFIYGSYVALPTGDSGSGNVINGIKGLGQAPPKISLMLT